MGLISILSVLYDEHGTLLLYGFPSCIHFHFESGKHCFVLWPLSGAIAAADADGTLYLWLRPMLLLLLLLLQ